MFKMQITWICVSCVIAIDIIASAPSVENAILEGKDLKESDETAKHAEWVDSFKASYSFTKENAEDIIRKDKRNRLLRIFIRSRNEEAGIGEYSLLCLGEA